MSTQTLDIVKGQEYTYHSINGERMHNNRFYKVMNVTPTYYMLKAIPEEGQTLSKFDEGHFKIGISDFKSAIAEKWYQQKPIEIIVK